MSGADLNLTLPCISSILTSSEPRKRDGQRGCQWSNSNHYPAGAACMCSLCCGKRPEPCRPMVAQDGDEIRIENPADAKGALEVLLIAGVPLNEPIARYGPFVMNTEPEMRQEFED